MAAHGTARVNVHSRKSGSGLFHVISAFCGTPVKRNAEKIRKNILYLHTLHYMEMADKVKRVLMWQSIDYSPYMLDLCTLMFSKCQPLNINLYIKMRSRAIVCLLKVKLMWNNEESYMLICRLGGFLGLTQLATPMFKLFWSEWDGWWATLPPPSSHQFTPTHSEWNPISMHFTPSDKHHCSHMDLIILCLSQIIPDFTLQFLWNLG